MSSVSQMLARMHLSQTEDKVFVTIKDERLPKNSGHAKFVEQCKKIEIRQGREKEIDRQAETKQRHVQ